MHANHRFAFVTTLLTAAALAGCDSTKHIAPTPTGSLTVTITPANGTKPSVVVTGPNAYTTTISSTTTLANLTLGSYTIVADTSVGPDSVVGTIVDSGHVTGSPATVNANDTAGVTVAYSMKSRMGGMWVANNSYQTVPELAANQLRTSGSPVPAETLFTALSGPAGLALDAAGNMWESSYGSGSDTLLMYTQAARNAGGAPTPSIVLTSTIGDGENLAFDSHGNLWVTDCTGYIRAFTPSQLAGGGAQTPAVSISGGTILRCPWSIAFDSTGNAWVADEGRTHIIEYGASQLTTSGTPTPIDTIGSTGGSLNEPSGLAFDAQGNLWVSNNGTTTVVEYTPAQLAAGGAPVPNIAINTPNTSDPFGLAFDNRGTLWVSDDNNGIMYGYTAAQLVTSGTPTPAVADTISLTNGFEPEQPLFDPYATAVGVMASRVHPHVGSLAVVRRANRNRPTTPTTSTVLEPAEAFTRRELER
jgi:sugar lactone lactonase YvrE